MRGSLFIQAGKIYFDYATYKGVYNSIVNKITDENLYQEVPDSVLEKIAYKKFQGDYVRVTDTNEIKQLKDKGLYVLVNGELDEKYSGVNEVLGDVLGNLLGAMTGKFQIAEDMTFNIYFSLRLNLGFKLYILPSFGIDIRDLDVAIDVWGEQNDLLDDGTGKNYVTSKDRDENNYKVKLLDGTKPHILGIYYDNDKDTGKAGLYIDAEALLGKEAKLFVDMSEYSLEEVITGLVAGIGKGASAQDASVASDDVTNLNPDKQSADTTSLFVNIFTNALALNVTSGFAKVLIKELMPDNASIADMLPNLKVYLKQNLRPYDITIGAILFNEKGDVPVFNLGLNIQGLNGVDGESSSIEFGRKEDILKTQQGSNAIFYYANFYRDNGNTDYSNYYGKNYNAKDYVKLKRDEGNDYIENADGSKGELYTGKDAEGNTFAGPEDRYMKAAPVMSEVLASRQMAFKGDLYTDVDGVYMLVYKRLNDIAGNNNLDEDTYREYRNLVNTNQFATYTGTLYVVDSNGNFVKTDKDTLKGFTGEGNLQYALASDYTSASEYEKSKKVVYNGQTYYPIEPTEKTKVDEKGNKYEVEYTSMEEADTFARNYPSAKVYKQVTDFTNYTKALALNLGDLLGGGTFDVASVLAGLESVELGMSLDIKATLDDVINWTYQFTRFIEDPQISQYLYFIATSLQANKECLIGLSVDLKAYLKLANLVKMIAGDKSVGILQALEGAKIYLELTYETNFHGNQKPQAFLWVEIRGGKLYLNLDMSEIGDIVGWGDFFSYGVVDGLDLSSILGSSSTTASAQAFTAADDEEVNTGLIPANIWSVLNVVLGRLLIANDFITVGLNETLIADLIGMLADSDSAVLQGISEFLPKLHTTDTKDTSGITINFYGNSPSIDINLGFKVGTLYYETVNNFNAMYGNDGKYFKGSNWSGATFKQESGEYTVGNGTDNDHTYVLVSTDDYALVTYAYPAWDGDTYDYDATTNKFTKHTESGTKGAYLKQGDFALAISLGKLYAKVNKDFSVDKDEKFADRNDDKTIKYVYVESANGEYVKNADGTYRLATAADIEEVHYAKQASYGNYVKLQNATAHLEMSIEISLYGSGKAAGKANEIDLSEILDMIMGLINPGSAISGSQLKLNIVNEFGNDQGAFLTLDLVANIDVETYKVELGLELNKKTASMTTAKTLLGVYLIENAVYVDLSGILGETAKIAVTDLNLDGLLEGVLGKFLGQEESTDASGASVASKEDIGTIEANKDHLREYAYFMINVTPQKLLLQLNADLVNAIYKKIMAIRGLEQKDLIPDIGDLLVRVDASESGAKKYVKMTEEEKKTYNGKTYNKVGVRYVEVTDGTKGDYKQDGNKTTISLNLRFSDGLYFCLDIPAGSITKDISQSVASVFGLSVAEKDFYKSISDKELSSYDGTRYAKKSDGTYETASDYVDGVTYYAPMVKRIDDKELSTYSGDKFVKNANGNNVLSSLAISEATYYAQSTTYTKLVLKDGKLYDGETEFQGAVYVKRYGAYELSADANYVATTNYYKQDVTYVALTAKDGMLYNGTELFKGDKVYVAKTETAENGKTTTSYELSTKYTFYPYYALKKEQVPRDYIEILSLDLESLVNGTGTFDISSLNLPTIGLKASLNFTMTSKNLKPGQDGYDESLAGWTKNLLANLLSGQAIFGQFGTLTWQDENTLTDGGKVYDGKVYVKNAKDEYVLYTEKTYAKGTKYFKYTLADINITMANEINLTIDIAANINLAPILAYGIGGILYSDIAVDIMLGKPVGTKLLSLYYLGSSRLMKKDGVNWELGMATSGAYTSNEIYSDALYVDASGLGLGKIKFQGIAGLLGVTPSYGAKTASGASVSADATTSDANTAGANAAASNALYLQIDIQNGRLGVSFDNAFITTLIGMLGLDLGDIELPPIKSVKLDVNLGAKGLDSINLNALLDSVGTSANVKIDNVELGFGESMVESANLIEQVKTGYTGLTFSKTSGIMNLIQNAIDSLKPGLSINIQNKVWQLTQARKVATLYQDSSITLTGKKILTSTKIDGSSSSPEKYNIRLDLASNRTSIGLKAILGGNNIFITDLSLPSGLVGNIAGLVSALKCLDLGSMMGKSPLLALVNGTDGDDATYEYPSAKTAAETSTTAASGWNKDKTSYTYPLNLENLIKSVEVNLFNDNGYWPYFDKATAVSNGAGKISVKVKLNKDSYNELIIMVTSILMGLMKDKINSDNGEPYFGDVQKARDGKTSITGKGLSSYLIDGIGDTNEITKFYDGLDALVKRGATTQEKVNYVEPFARSLPVTLTKWALLFALDAANISLGYGTIQNLASEVIEGLNFLIGGILPIPFASGEIDPSVNIYVDLNPTASEYGCTGDQVVKPGIQAIEIMVNAEKNGTGTAMKYNKAQTTNKSDMNRMANGGGAVAAGSANSTTTELSNAWDFFMLRITPYSIVDTSAQKFNTGMLYFDDAESAEKVTNEVAAPTEIVIDDPATRSGNAVKSDGSSVPVTLRDSAFLDATVFPQYANVKFPVYLGGKQMQSYDSSGDYKDAVGTQIVWDAATVDLTAATSEDTNGRRLAGYVYGYALNVVLYAIPVYVTNDKEAQTQSIKGYYNINGKYTEKALGIDIDTNSSKYMAELPDLVRILFRTGGKYTFATYLKDSAGNMAYAVINPISGAPSENGYQILVQPTQEEIDKGATANLNKDGNKCLLMPAYIAGLKTVKDKDGNDVYQTVKIKNEDGTEVEYYVLDRNNLPKGKQFPAGTIDWNTDDFKYDWQGSTEWTTGAGSNVVKVGFTYQWGLGKAVTDTISLTAKNYKIARLTSMSNNESGTVTQNFKSERDSGGNYTTILELKAMDIDASMQNLVTYLGGFRLVNGKFINESSMTGFDVEWDTTELAKALNAITTKDSSGNDVVNYYKGLDVTVKAKVGGKRFSIFTSVTKNLVSTDKSGFVGKSESFAGKFAQEVNVRIVVKPYVFASMANALVFDQYRYEKITAASFGNTFRINVKDASGNTRVENLTVGNGLSVEAPFIKAGETYLNAYNNAVHKLTSDEITYEGYSNQRAYPLYAKLVIGTEYSGKQEVYVPIEVNAVKPSAVTISVEHGNTLNPKWYERYDEFNVSVGKNTYTMFPDWTTVQYYTNAACTKLKSQQNIFDGGTIYAQVEAYATADGTKGGTKLALVNTGEVDESGKPVYAAQKITLRLNVEQQTIQSVNFFYDETIGDIAAYLRKYASDEAKLAELEAKLADINNYTGSVYQQTHEKDGTWYGIDPINFATNPSDYFKTSDWGDAKGGTPVKVNLVNGESYIAFVRAFDTVVSGKDVKGTGNTQTCYMTIGNNKVPFNVNIPSYEFIGGAMSDAESKLTYVDGKVAGAKDDAKDDTLKLAYNVFDEWKLPSTATVQTAQGVGDTTVDVKWVDYAAPNKDELKSDADGKLYVERKYFFFDGLTMRYPSADAFTAKIYLENFNTEVKEIVPDGMSLKYDVFDKFEFARTATVYMNDGTKHENVPIRWESTSMPTADEIKQGSFTRKIRILGAYVEGQDVYSDYVVTVNNDFTIDTLLNGFKTGITGDYKAGNFAIDVAKDNFYQGLPKSANIMVDTKTIPVTLAWSDNYTAESGFNGKMTLTITSKDGDNVVLESDVNVAVKVESAGITGLAKGQKYDLDPYAMSGTLFESGSLQEVKVSGSDNTQYVAVEYDFDNQAFYDNVASHFGKKYKVAVTYKYNAGKNDNVETGEIEVYVVGRSIMFMSDYADRSIVVDTFLHKDASYLANKMRITTTGGDVFDAYFDWSDVDKLIKSGKSNTAYMATAIVGVEKANGGYVLADITDDDKVNPTYVAIEDYVEYKQKTNPNFALTNEKRYMLAKQRVNIPVTVLDRTIADAELLLGNTDLEYLYSDSSKYSTITDTLVGKTNGAYDGRYIDIVYNKATGMPEQYVYNNHFAYVGANKLPDTMQLTFVNGDVGKYYITYENAPTASDLAGLTTTLDRKMTVHVYDMETKKIEVMDAFEMSIKIRVSKVTLTNSDLAYNDMSVGSYKYNKDVYADRANTVYDTSKYASTATFYVGAQFMLAQTWWTDGRSANGSKYDYNSTYTKRHGFTDTDGEVYPGIYSVYSVGSKFKAEGEEGNYEGVKFYIYNADTKNYALYNGTVKYDSANTTYKSESGQDLYILVYVTTQTLNASWNADSVNYTYRGGNVAVEATLTSGVEGNGATEKVDVTVHVNNSRVNGEATLVSGDTCGLLSGGKFVIDPYANGNVFARKTGYSGDRYEKSSAATSGYVKNNLDGTYKLVDGQYVELTEEELNRDYANFPTRLTVTLANGTNVDVPVTWDFSGVNVTYAGGEYYAYAIVNYDGAYNYKATDSSSANEVGTQRIRFNVKVLDRRIRAGKDGIANETELKKLAGYAYGVSSGVAAFVNPYEYIKPTMPTELSLNERQADGNYKAMTYSTRSNERKLVWSFDEFRPSYNGGVIYVTAKLIGIDGNVQTYKIPFLVQKMEATAIKEAQTTVGSNGVTKLTPKTGGYSSTINSGVATESFSIDPNDPNRLSMPFMYIATFKVSTPNYDAANDKVTGFTVVTEPKDLDFFYAIVSMPADEQYTVTSSGITTSASGNTATIQLGDQERISVKVVQTNANLAPTISSASGLHSGTTLQTTTTVNGSRVNVVWFGTAEVYSASDNSLVASYAVMFSSAGTSLTLPTSADRKIVYKLYAAVGTVVDSNGTVVTTEKATQDFANSHSAVEVGQTIPVAQAISTLEKIEWNPRG